MKLATRIVFVLLGVYFVFICVSIVFIGAYQFGYNRGMMCMFNNGATGNLTCPLKNF